MAAPLEPQDRAELVPEPEPDVLLEDVHPDEVAALAALGAEVPEAPAETAEAAEEQPELASEFVPEPSATNGIEPEVVEEAPPAAPVDADRQSERSFAIASDPPTAEVPAAEVPAPPVPVAAGAPRDLPPGEEAVDLGQYLPGEEPINLDEYDPDPLGLEGPLHPRG